MKHPSGIQLPDAGRDQSCFVPGDTTALEEIWDGVCGFFSVSL